eukprot:gene15659-33082_t
MEFFKIKKDIPFMRHAMIFNAISFITFALAVFFLFSRGLHLSVEFTGGTVMEVSYTQPAEIEKIRTTVSSLGLTDVQVQNFGNSRDVMIRLPAQKGVSTAQQSDTVMAALKAQEPTVQLRRTEFVGPSVGEELAQDGLKALGMVVVGIMVYLAFRFEWKYAVAAIIANLHDVIIILGFFAFFQWEFSLSVLAAVLAALSGWLFAHFQRTVNPSPFGLSKGIEYLFMAVIGGVGHVWGAIVGAGLIRVLEDQLQVLLPKLIGTSGSYEVIVFGIALVGGLQYLPDGPWSLV